MTAILILLVLLFPTQPAEPWTWSQRVEYQENHDPNMVWLRDGRKLQVEFSVIPWKIVDKWPAGKALELVYDAELGLRLVDPESKRFSPVLGGLEKLPIDLALAACLEKNGTTTGMVDCYREAEGCWDRELTAPIAPCLRRSTTSPRGRFRKRSGPG